MSLALAVPGWLEEHRRHLADVNSLVTSPVALRARSVDRILATTDLFQSFLLSADRSDTTEEIWASLCESICTFSRLHAALQQDMIRTRGALWLSPQIRWWFRTDKAIVERAAAVVRVVLLSRPELGLTLPADLEPIVWTVRISPFAHLRAMFNLFWSAIRHPFSETTIDLSTGRVLYHT